VRGDEEHLVTELHLPARVAELEDAALVSAPSIGNALDVTELETLLVGRESLVAGVDGDASLRRLADRGPEDEKVGRKSGVVV
jgi:hypothetical protein